MNYVDQHGREMPDTNVGRLIALMGGKSRLALACGVNAAMVSRWVRDRQMIPPKYNALVVAYEPRARKLLDWTCPTCGGRMK